MTGWTAPPTPPTVGEIVQALQALDPNMPLIVSTHYDNDVGYSSEVQLSVEDARPVGEANAWDLTDDPTDHGVIRAAVLTGSTL